MLRLPVLAARALVLTLALGLGADATAAPLVVTAEEDAALRAREVVLRQLPARSAGEVRVFAIVDVPADQAAVWEALLDFEARKAANAAVQSVGFYKPKSATDWWVRWEIAKFGMSVIYHNRYILDRANGRLTHELDPSQTNDLAASRGVYELHPSPMGAGWTRLSYDCSTNFGGAIPGFVQKWMSTSATRDFMTNMAARAEAAAK